MLNGQLEDTSLKLSDLFTTNTGKLSDELGQTLAPPLQPVLGQCRAPERDAGQHLEQLLRACSTTRRSSLTEQLDRTSADLERTVHRQHAR